MSAPGTRRTIAALVACQLIPVPLLDTFAQNLVRRAWVGWHARRYGPTPDLVTDRPLVTVKGLLLNPVKALVKKAFPPIVLWDTWVLVRETRELGARLEAGRAELPAAVEVS